MENQPSSQRQQAVIEQDLLDACIHCGLCLPACPTYLATGRELESPRGRIYLLNLWQQNKQPFSARMAEHIDSCLGCLGCQTACPSGVNYESIFNQAKVQVNNVAPIFIKLPRYLAFRFLLPNEKLLKVSGAIMRIWQRSGAQNFVKSLLDPLSNIKLFREFLRWQTLLPVIPKHSDLPLNVAGSNKTGERLSFFKGCVMDIFYNPVNRESLHLLALTAANVSVPDQTCCGALALHAGEIELARQLACQNIEKFSRDSASIVVSASGCAAMLKNYPELFDKNQFWHDRAVKFTQRVQDLPEYLAKQDLCVPTEQNESQIEPMRIGYHAACHLAHAQNIRLEPKVLLENFARKLNQKAGMDIIKIIPLMEEEQCCGSAGIYNLGHPDLSQKILDRKIQMIKNAGVSKIVTTNPGCILQIEAGLRQQGLDVEVLHLATLLSKAYLNSF